MKQNLCCWCRQPVSGSICLREHPDYDHREAKRRGIVFNARVDDEPDIGERSGRVTVTGEPTRVMPRRRGRPSQVVGNATALRCPRCAGRVVMQGRLRWCEDCAHELAPESASTAVAS